MPGQNRLRRSELTTPASSPRMIRSAAERSEADVVILDLEDATAAREKEAARSVVAATAPRLDWGPRTLAVRTNAVGSRWFQRDVELVVPALADVLAALVVPKVESRSELEQADALLSRVEEEAGMDPGGVALEVLVESPRAVLELEGIALASKRLEALIFGVADYAAATGARLGDDVFTDFMYAKQRIVAVARAHGLAPIDCVTFRYKDLEATRRDAERAARMGFEGKWCVHPLQAPVVNKAFSPTDAELEWARGVVAAFEAAEKEGRGATDVGGGMVDLATVRVAMGVIAAREAGRDPSGGRRRAVDVAGPET